MSKSPKLLGRAVAREGAWAKSRPQRFRVANAGRSVTPTARSAISLGRAFFDSSACRRSHPKSRRTECRFRYNRRCKQKSYRNRHRKSSGSGCERPCAVPAPDGVRLTTDSVVLPNQDRWTRPATLVHGSHTANRLRTVCGRILRSGPVFDFSESRANVAPRTAVHRASSASIVEAMTSFSWPSAQVCLNPFRFSSRRLYFAALREVLSTCAVPSLCVPASDLSSWLAGIGCVDPRTSQIASAVFCPTPGTSII
jgi:hypothetical protein